MTVEDDLIALLSEQGLLILSLRDRITELETKCDEMFAHKARLEARVLELTFANATLRGMLSQSDP